MPVNPIGMREALIGNIMNRRSKSSGGDLGSILMDAANAKLLNQVVNTPTRKRTPNNAAMSAIADRYDSTASRYRAASTNIQNSHGRSNVADAALKNANDIMGRLTELSAMASDPTMNDGDRSSLNAEAQELQQELNNMGTMTRYNGQEVLTGSSTSTYVGDGTISSTDADISNVTNELVGLDLSTQNGANAALTQVDSAMSKLTEERAKVGATANRFDRADNIAMTQATNLASSAENMRTSMFGEIGSLFGEDLAPFVNQLFGFE